MYGRLLLTDRNVDTNNVLALLIDDGIRGDNRFTCLTVADDKLTLTSADRNHGVDRLDTRLKRNGYGFSFDNTVSLTFDGAIFRLNDRALGVNGLTERVNDTTDHIFADGNGNNASRTFYKTALADADVITEKNRAYHVFFQVERHTEGAVCKFQKLVCLAFFNAVNLGNTVTYGDNIADLILFCLFIIIFDLFFYDLADVIDL